jgi:ribosomal protein S12 methylthiotransferase accessory factor
MVVRSSRMALRIDPVRREFGARFLPRLNGQYSLSELVAGEHRDDVIYALVLLGDLTRHGMLHDGGEPAGGGTQPDGAHDCVAGGSEPDRAAADLSGARITVVGRGPLVEAVMRRLGTLGATVQPGGLGTSHSSADLVLVCADGPNLDLLEKANQAAFQTRVSWLPLFMLGEEFIVGPWIDPGVSACFRCLELRWLGISPSIACERAYLDHLRGGGSRDEAACFTDNNHTAEFAVTVVSRWLSAPRMENRVVIAPFGGDPPVETWIERHPLCDICGERDRAQARLEDVDWHEPEVALRGLRSRLARLTADRFGLAALTPLRSQVTSRTSGRPVVALARFAIPEPRRVGGEQDNWCHGCAWETEDAEAVAIIEALERYCGLSPAPSAVVAPYECVADEAILPTELPLYSDAQYAIDGFPYRPFRRDESLRWTWGFSVLQKRSILVPSAAAYFGEDDTLLDETSSGIAAHTSRARALENAVLELIERDAFMVHWLHRISPPIVDIERSDDRLTAVLVSYVRDRGYDVRLADITTDLDIPAALALAIHDDKRRPALVVGGGASLDPVEAQRRALRELYAAVVAQPERWSPGSAMAAEDVRRLDDHAAAYAHPSWLGHASFLWASGQRRAPPVRREPHGEVDGLSQMVAHLSARGFEIIGVDITARDIAPYGVRVMRAIVPGLQPLGFGPSGLRLGGRRLYEAPVRMGACSSPPAEQDLNRFPHCFP